MQNYRVNLKLYTIFGVAKYAERLRKENKHNRLKQLEETLSRFILVKGIEDLSPEARKKLTEAKINDGLDLYNFFNKHIVNFQERLKEYGREFRETIVAGR